MIGHFKLKSINNRTYFKEKVSLIGLGDIMGNELFWEQVKRICKKSKITQKDLAQFCGVPLSTFKGWIQKNYFPTVIDGYIMADKLGVSVEFLVTGKENGTRMEVEKIRIMLHRVEEKLGKLPV